MPWEICTKRSVSLWTGLILLFYFLNISWAQLLSIYICSGIWCDNIIEKRDFCMVLLWWMLVYIWVTHHCSWMSTYLYWLLRPPFLYPKIITFILHTVPILGLKKCKPLRGTNQYKVGKACQWEKRDVKSCLGLTSILWGMVNPINSEVRDTQILWGIMVKPAYIFNTCMKNYIKHPKQSVLWLGSSSYGDICLAYAFCYGYA